MTKSNTNVFHSMGLKGIKNLLCMCLLGLIINQVSAQTLIQIGTGASGPSVGTNPSSGAAGASPYGINVSSGNMGKKLQIIYTAAQINAAMTAAGYGGGASVISTVAWDISDNIGSNYPHLGYTIKMANVAQTSFVSAATPYTGSTTTVWGPTSQSYGASGTGYLVTHTLVTPFTWDGTSSLLVEVCYTISGVGSAVTYGGCRRTTTASNQMIYNGGASISCATSSYVTAVAAIPNMKLTVAAACTAPTTPATPQAFSALTTNSVQVNWTRGNGDAGVVVVAHAATAVSANPASGTDYTAGQNAAFGSGTNLGSNNYVVYAGTGTSVNVTGLSGATTYNFSVFEYNAATPILCYKTPGAASSQYIPACVSFPTTNATSSVFSNIINNALTLSYTRGNGSNVLVVARLSATAQVFPAFNASYTANAVFGSGNTTGAGNFVVLNGTSNTVTVTGLANATAYSFDVYEYNATPNCYSITPLVGTTSTLDGTTSGGCSATVVRTTSAANSGNDANYTAIAPAVVINSAGTTTGYYQGGAINTPGAGIPIGFNFVYNGTTYTSFGLGVNGYIWFGSGVPATNATNPISNASANLGGTGTIDGIISAAGVALFATNATGGQNIGYTLSGSAPNRVLTIQWKGYKLASGTGTLCSLSGFPDINRCDFQIILNEDGGANSNKIGIAYADMAGYCVGANTSTAQVGIRGASNAIFTNRTSTNGNANWANTAGTLNTQVCSMGASTWINGNTLITFTPAVTTQPTINGFASGGSASNSCPATSVLLTGAGFSSYQWFLNGSIVPGPGSSASTFSATQSGAYTVVGKSGSCYVQSSAFTVTINSCGTAPSFTTCPDNQLANTSGSCNATVNYTVVASGTPAPTLTYSFSGATTASGSGDGSGSAFNTGTTTVTVSASNGTLPDATCTFNVTVTDNESPVPNVASLPDVTAECSGTATAPTATDNCAGTITATTLDPTSYSTQGSFVIHWSYDDGNGNVVTQNQNVIIDDVTNPIPTLASLPDITAECSASATAPTATDNCAGTLTATTLDPTSYSTQGTFVIHWSYDDGSGNIVTQNQNVIVDDVTNPIINDCPLNITSCNPVVTWTVPTASDNCGTPSFSSNFAPGATFPVGTTTVTYTADDGHGNTATCSFDITINTSSVQATSATSDSPFNTICVGGSTNLTVNGGSLGEGASWKWYSGSCGGTLAGTGASINVTPTINTTYFVRAEGTCNTTACASLTITVSSAPVTSLALMPFTGMPANLCNGTVATLSVAPVNKATFYVWDAPTGSYFNGNPLNISPFTTATPSVTITFGNPSGSLYAIGVQAGNACGSSVRQSQKVRGLTSVPASISGALTACANTGGSYSTPLVTGASSYLWSITGNATVSGTGTTATVTFGPTWTGGTLCVAAQTTCYTSPTKCISITNTAATLGTISGTFTACPNAVLNYSVPTSAGAASYSWTSPAGSTVTSGQGTNSISVTYSPTYSAAGNICVNVTSVCGVTSANKCKTVAPGLPSLPSSISGPVSGLCNQTVVFNCPSQGAGTTYNWTAPSGATINSGQGSTAINVTFGTLSTGSMCVVAHNACGNSASRCITVKGAPATPGAITASPGSWCANDQGIEFNVNVSSLTGVYVLSWLYPTPPVATYVLGGGNSTSLLMDWGTGSGVINVKASNACGSGTKSSTWSSSCREGEVATVNALTVSPNPTTGIINVSYIATRGNTAIVVLDVAGRVVVTQNASCVEGMNNTQVNMSRLAKGAYILQIQSTQGSKQVRVVVE